jgi:hypothetical protein
MNRDQCPTILWASANKRWEIRQHPTNDRLCVFRSDVKDCEVTPFDTFIPAYVDRAYSRILYGGKAPKPYDLLAHTKG